MTTYASSSTTVGVGIGTDGEQGKSLLIPALIIGGGLGLGALVILLKENKK